MYAISFHSDKNTFPAELGLYRNKLDSSLSGQQRRRTTRRGTCQRSRQSHRQRGLAGVTVQA